VCATWVILPRIGFSDNLLHAPDYESWHGFEQS
jgi:hypothetical protein